MGTFYGYVKQDVDSQLDWGQVGKTFSDMLNNENARREGLKKEIDDNTVADLETLANIPKGSNEEYNKWTTDAANKISQARLLQVKELKAGRLDLKDYNYYTQNTRSGVKTMTNYVKSYNDFYDKGMKRAQTMTSSNAEVYIKQLAEQMKFKDTTPNIALDGSMSVSKLVKNPKTGLMEVSSNPADAFSFSSMMDMSKLEIDRFKANEVIADIAKNAGEYTKVYGQGRISTISDIFQKDAKGNYINKEGVAALRKVAQGSLVNDFNTQSVLSDALKFNPKTGNAFEFTVDANDPRLKGKNRDDVILLDKANGFKPKLTDAQNNMAVDYMMSGIDAMSKRDEGFREPPQQPYRTPRDTSGEAQEATAANMLGKIWSGNQNEVNAGLQYFSGLHPEWKSVTVDKDKGVINVTDKDGNVSPINMKDASGNIMNIYDFAASASGLTGIKDVRKAFGASGITSTMPYSKEGGYYSRRKPKDSFDTLSTGTMVGDKYVATPLKEKLNQYKDPSGYNSDENLLNAGIDYAKSSLENFDSSDTQGSTIAPVTSEEARKLFKDDTPRIKIFLPNLMEQPAYLKVLGQASDASLLENVMRGLYNYAGTGGKLKPYQLNEIIAGKKISAPKATQSAKAKPVYQGLDENGNPIYK